MLMDRFGPYQCCSKVGWPFVLRAVNYRTETLELSTFDCFQNFHRGNKD